MKTYSTEQYRDIQEAWKIISEHPAWRLVAAFEADLLNSFIESDDVLAITHPVYERMKAYNQGAITALTKLFQERRNLKKG